jgi:hypothetical protein
MITPYIYLSNNFLVDSSLQGNIVEKQPSISTSAVAIAARMEDIRKKIKKHTNYIWDCQHFVVTDSKGRAALNVIFNVNGTMSFLSARTNTMVGQFTDELIDDHRQEVSDAIGEWAEKAADGMVRCSDCGRWVDIYHPVIQVHYSYTSSVCNDCYNPKKHLSPNTNG